MVNEMNNCELNANLHGANIRQWSPSIQ
jgi:hypothetical protein